MQDRHEIIKNIIKDNKLCTAHDLDHVLRVYNLCKRLAVHEAGVDMDILIPAALLHDIARVIEDEDKSGESDHAVLGAKMASGILERLGYEEGAIERIKHCILAHRFRSGHNPETIEAKILFDADKLDVIGAIGIARSFMVAGQHGEKLFQDIPIEEYIVENVGENGRIKDNSKHGINLEFELKLKKIPQRLYTKKGKEIALRRISYMEEFFRILREEINGEN
ncbi:MAG: phosphohydrolase [Gracilibacter sp. BRH_c7a]|nr:MAG: phosphohydrolase [Gracilibacter sp. BRH_c7a]